MKVNFSRIALSVYGLMSTVTQNANAAGTINCLIKNDSYENIFLYGSNLTWIGNVTSDYRVYFSSEAPEEGEFLPTETANIELVEPRFVQTSAENKTDSTSNYAQIGWYTLCDSSAQVYELVDCAATISQDKLCTSTDIDKSLFANPPTRRPTSRPSAVPTSGPTSLAPTTEPTSSAPTIEPTSPAPTSNSPTTEPTSPAPTSNSPTTEPTSPAPTSNSPTTEPTSPAPSSNNPTSEQPTSRPVLNSGQPTIYHFPPQSELTKSALLIDKFTAGMAGVVILAGCSFFALKKCRTEHNIDSNELNNKLNKIT